MLKDYLPSIRGRSTSLLNKVIIPCLKELIIQSLIAGDRNKTIKVAGMMERMKACLMADTYK